MGAAPRRSEMARSGDARTFVTLDGLRGIAALCVAFGHARFMYAGAPTELFSKSYLAVDFFFILSGFVLEHAYGEAIQGGMLLGQFLALRIIRLYPLYVLALLLSAVLALLQPAGAIAETADWPFALLLIPSPFSNDHLFPINIPAWSLFFEIIANLAFATAGRLLSTRILAAFVASAAVAMLLGVHFGWGGFGGNAAIDVGVNWSSIGGGFIRVAFSFFAGVLIYRIWLRRTPRFQVHPVVIAALLFALLMAYPEISHQPAFDLALAMIAFPIIVFLGASSVPGKRIGKWLSWFGGISYGIYVLQMFAVTFIQWAVATYDGTKFKGVSAPSVIVSIGSLIVLATVCDVYFDRPVRRLIKATLGWSRRQRNAEIRNRAAPSFKK
jgi:peptidoglycan/LPS O-acetylase OafA/YrhL